VFKDCSPSVQAAARGEARAAAPHVPGGPFRRERAPGRRWQGPEGRGWRARPRAGLWYLVEPPGRLVTKAEGLRHVWGGPQVRDTVLRVGRRAMRVALADPVEAPQYLPTVGRQGDQGLVAGAGVAVPLAVARPSVGGEALHPAFSPGGGPPPGPCSRAPLPPAPTPRAESQPRRAPRANVWH
jgi:hypothetical protein